MSFTQKSPPHHPDSSPLWQTSHPIKDQPDHFYLVPAPVGFLSGNGFSRSRHLGKYVIKVLEMIPNTP